MCEIKHVLTSRKHEEGVTLLEVLLVLVIAAALLIMSFRQYQVMRADQDLQRIQYNVDTIFQGLSGFYKANCYGQSASGPLVTHGALYVSSSTPTPANPFPVNIQTKLINDGYMANNLLSSQPVNNTVGTNGYVAQFNQFTQTRNICVANTGATAAYGSNASQNCQTPTKIGVILSWKAQVAVDIGSAANAKTYLALLNGDCLSTMSGGVVIPCSSSGNTGTFVVFERLPSFARQSSVSDSYEMNPIVDQFTQQYTTYFTGYLLNSLGQNPDGDNQYFYCGG